MPGNHARLAPSAGGRWSLCPGSPSLIESLPPEQQDRPNKDAMWGTACHEVLSRSLIEKRSPASFVGETIVVNGKAEEAAFSLAERSFRITEEDANNVQHAYGYAVSRMMEYGADTMVMVEEVLDCGANFHTMDPIMEMEVPAPRDDCWGTGDIVLCGNGYLEVIDYKNGRRWVNHENNTQLLLYLLGALRHVEAGQVQRVRLTIVQPRAVVEAAPEGSTMREAVRTWEFEEADIIEHAVRLGTAAHATSLPSPPLVPGEHCRDTFCPAQAICPALNNAAQEALLGEQSGMDGWAEVERQGGLAPSGGDLAAMLAISPEAITEEQLAAVLSAREMVRSWLNAVEEHALKLMLRGSKVPDFKLVRGRRSQSWNLTGDELLKKLGNMNRIGDDGKSAGKLKKDSYTELKPISPAQARTRLKPMVTERTWKNIEALIEWSEGKPTIAPATDHREELVIETTAEAFGLDNTTPSEENLPDFLQ